LLHGKPWKRRKIRRQARTVFLRLNATSRFRSLQS